MPELFIVTEDYLISREIYKSENAARKKFKERLREKSQKKNGWIALVLFYSPSTFDMFREYIDGAKELLINGASVKTLDELLINRNIKFIVNPAHFIDFVCEGALYGPLDRRSTHETPWFNIYRVPFGFTKVKDGCIVARMMRREIVGAPQEDFEKDFHPFDNFKKSLIKRVESRSVNDRIGVEVSGGIDSAITLNALKSGAGKYQVEILSGSYPFREFSLEQGYLNEVLLFNNETTSAVYSKDLLAFGNFSCAENFDLPSSWIGGSSQSRFMEDLAVTKKSSIIVNSHGGDVLFNPVERLSRQIDRDAAANILGLEWSTLKHSIKKLELERSRTSLRMLAFDACQAGYVDATCGENQVSKIGAFLDEEFVYKMIDINLDFTWSYDGRQKELAYMYFKKNVPQKVWSRAEKVDHRSLFYRGIRENYDALQQSINSIEAGPYRAMCDLKILRNYAKQLYGFECDPNPSFTPILSFLTWATLGRETC